VQEGITNVRKHAPGALLTIRLTGDPASGLSVVMRNRLGFAAAAAPGAGLGLVGLTERAQLREGWLRHGVDGAWFTLEAWLPWAP
jgi:signal transduction histidine kinase